MVHCRSVKSTTSDSFQSPLRMKGHGLEPPPQSAQCQCLSTAPGPQQKSPAVPLHLANLKLALYRMGHVDSSSARKAVCRGFFIACCTTPVAFVQGGLLESDCRIGRPTISSSASLCSVHVSHAYSVHGVNGLWTCWFGVVCPISDDLRSDLGRYIGLDSTAQLDVLKQNQPQSASQCWTCMFCFDLTARGLSAGKMTDSPVASLTQSCFACLYFYNSSVISILTVT